MALDVKHSRGAYLALSQHKADRYVKRFTTRNQLVTLLYAQAGDKKSLRDIQNGLSSHAPQLYHPHRSNY